MLKSDLKKALRSRDFEKAIEAASKAIEVLAETLEPGLKAVLIDVMLKVGEVSANQLKRRLRGERSAAGFRASVEINDFAFDVTDPRAVEWIQEHAGETISGINQVTREQIRDLVEEAFVDQFDVDQLADEIAAVIGDTERAEVIARTEVQKASNQGQLEAWEQAKEGGLLTGRESKEWIVTPDDRLCPICEPMDGRTVGLNENFDVDGDQLDGPPAHPNCRCTLGLTL